MNSAIPGQEVPGGIRKQAGKATGSRKEHLSMASVSVPDSRFLPGIPSPTLLDDKL